MSHFLNPTGTLRALQPCNQGDLRENHRDLHRPLSGHVIKCGLCKTHKRHTSDATFVFVCLYVCMGEAQDNPFNPLSIF